MKKTENVKSHSASMNQTFERLGQNSPWKFIRKLMFEYFKPVVSPNEGLRYWQEWVLQSILGIAVAFGLIAIVPLIILAFAEGLWFLVLFNISALVLGTCLIYARKIAYVKRVVGALIICYTMGVGLIMMIGLTSGGPYWLFAFAIITALLLNLEAAMGALILNAVTLILASWLAHSNQNNNEITIYFAPARLAISWLNFLLLNAITAISASVIVKSINSSFLVERNARIQLRNERQILISTQDALGKEIEARKQTEIALRKREKKYRLLAENVSDHIWILDLEAFLFIYTSPSITSVLGYSPSEIIGTPLWDYIHPESVERVKKKLFEELRKKEDGSNNNGRIRTIEFMERHKNGTMVWVETQVSFIRDKGGLPISILGVSRDISRRKAAETKLIEAYAALDQRVWERTVELSEKNEELRHEIDKRKKAQELSERANKAKSDFLANMSHELRTPLNHIIGFTELVADKHFGPLNEIQEEYLNDVLNSSRHLLSLINDILDLSKVEAGKMVLNLSNVRLPTLLATSLNMIREKAIKHKIQLTSEIDNSPKRIRADERKLKQIMYNLLSNAAKFTPDEGLIHVTAKSIKARKGHLITSSGKKISLPLAGSHTGNKPREYIEIMVSDTGIGVTSEDITKIFAPFEQVESDTNRKYQGTGLGLPLSKRLVELHGGWIWAESDGPDKGSQFYVVIPVEGLN
jgi:PAS domain S-box-containing protein